MVFSEKTLYSLGRRCVYIFNRRKAKKEIPVATLLRGADGSEKYRLEKKRLTNHIYQKGKIEDFRHFCDLHDAVSAILASRKPRGDAASKRTTEREA